MGTVSIPLTQGKSTIIDEEDLPLVGQYKWHLISGRIREYAGAKINLGGGNLKDTRLHRLLINPPDDMDVDHINLDGLDNRRCNLRIATRAENLANMPMHRRNTVGYKGVHPRPEVGQVRYTASIGYEGQPHYLGIYATAEDAAHAYDAKAREFYGEFARLNFPDSTESPCRAPLYINNTSGYRGVTLNKRSGKWLAYHDEAGKRRWLGNFSTPDEAAHAVQVYIAGLD